MILEIGEPVSIPGADTRDYSGEILKLYSPLYEGLSEREGCV